jgi:hypothetical protein
LSKTLHAPEFGGATSIVGGGGHPFHECSFLVQEDLLLFVQGCLSAKLRWPLSCSCCPPIQVVFDMWRPPGYVPDNFGPTSLAVSRGVGGTSKFQGNGLLVNIENTPMVSVVAMQIWIARQALLCDINLLSRPMKR